MKLVKTNKKRKKYKTTNNWLDQLYNKNKKEIDAKIEQPSNPKVTKKQVFKELVKEYIDEGQSPEKAVESLTKSTIFRSDKERIHENAWHGLKEDKDAYKKFREMTKEHGRYAKIDPSKLHYEGGNVYTYGDVVIDFQNSPKQVIVSKA